MRRQVFALAAALAAVGASVAALQGTANATSADGAPFRVGAAFESYTPPTAGALQSDPANCLGNAGLGAAESQFTGKRYFAFEEPYIDEMGDGHYDPGDPFIDCNGDGRWDGDTLGGGSGSPRYYDYVADPVGARAVVVDNGRKTIAMEVVDNEGLFNTYADEIRAKVLADGYRIDNIQISSTHDESAPDTIGLGGAEAVMSGTNQYFVSYLVQKSALAIEHAYDNMVPAHIRYAEAVEPSNLRQCWSSYPFIDNPLMPVMQAMADDGSVIATLASVSQHTETLGFNGGPQGDPGDPNSPKATLDQEKLWVTADWPHWFTSALEQTYGGVGIEMAGAVGSVETPEVFQNPDGSPAPLSRTPQQFIDEGHPAGCRTLFNAPTGASKVPLGYYSETKALGEDLAGAVENALTNGSAWSQTNRIWAQTTNICVPVANALFKAAALAGVFAERAAYLPGCRKIEKVPAVPTGQTAGTSVQSQVAAWRIGDAEFIGAPGEVFPVTFFRGPVGPEDMNYPQYGMPAWPLPYMHTPWRFFDGLDNDMIGYIFPRGNDAGVPGQHVVKNPQASGTDRFGCGHSDDSEAVNDKSGDIIGAALVAILERHAVGPEAVEQGRYVVPDPKVSSGYTLSRNPEGLTDTIKCTAPTDTTFVSYGSAVAVWEPGVGVIHPAAWMDLLGHAQTAPDRTTRGYIDSVGHRHWLDVFPDISGQPSSVTP
jgi:hypothetical protein